MVIENKKRISVSAGLNVYLTTYEVNPIDFGINVVLSDPEGLAPAPTNNDCFYVRVDTNTALKRVLIGFRYNLPSVPNYPIPIKRRPNLI